MCKNNCPFYLVFSSSSIVTSHSHIVTHTHILSVRLQWKVKKPYSLISPFVAIGTKKGRRQSLAYEISKIHFEKVSLDHFVSVISSYFDPIFCLQRFQFWANLQEVSEYLLWYTYVKWNPVRYALEWLNTNMIDQYK